MIKFHLNIKFNKSGVLVPSRENAIRMQVVLDGPWSDGHSVQVNDLIRELLPEIEDPKLKREAEIYLACNANGAAVEAVEEGILDAMH